MDVFGRLLTSTILFKQLAPWFLHGIFSLHILGSNTSSNYGRRVQWRLPGKSSAIVAAPKPLAEIRGNKLVIMDRKTTVRFTWFHLNLDEI